MAIDKRSPQTFYRMRYRKGISTDVYDYDIEPGVSTAPTPTGTVTALQHDLNNGDTGEHILVGDTTKLAHIDPSNFNPPPSVPANARTLRLYRSGNFTGSNQSNGDIQYLRTGLATGATPIDPAKTGHAITAYYTKYKAGDGNNTYHVGFLMSRLQVSDLKTCYYAVAEISSSWGGYIRLYKGNILAHDRTGDSNPETSTGATHLGAIPIDTNAWTTSIVSGNAMRWALQVENQPTAGEVGIRVLVRTATPTSNILNPTNGSWTTVLSVVDASSALTSGAMGLGHVTPTGIFGDIDLLPYKHLFAGVELYGYTV